MAELSTSLWKIFYHFLRKQPIAFLVFFLVPISIILEINVIPYALKIFVDRIVEYQFSSDRGDIIEEIASALWLGGFVWFGFIIMS